MKKEEGWEMYLDIKHLKVKGFSNSKIASMLGISRPTVIKYVNMDADDFDKGLASRKQRVKKPDIYQNEIMSWLKCYPDMTSAQVYDRLEEKYREIAFNETTLRSYVSTMTIHIYIPIWID